MAIALSTSAKPWPTTSARSSAAESLRVPGVTIGRPVRGFVALRAGAVLAALPFAQEEAHKTNSTASHVESRALLIVFEAPSVLRRRSRRARPRRRYDRRIRPHDGRRGPSDRGRRRVVVLVVVVVDDVVLVVEVPIPAAGDE